jgi:ribonuclease HI
MEVMAAIEGLRAPSKPCEVEVVTYSDYLRRGMTEFLQRWRSNGRKAASGNPALNQDLWWELAELAGYHRVTWIRVGGLTQGTLTRNAVTLWRLSRRGKGDRIRRRGAEHGYRHPYILSARLAIESCRLNGP